MFNPFYLTAPATPPCFEEFMKFMKCLDLAEDKTVCHEKLLKLVICLKEHGADI